jgi:hypothetical protein
MGPSGNADLEDNSPHDCKGRCKKCAASGTRSCRMTEGFRGTCLATRQLQTQPRVGTFRQSLHSGGHAAQEHRLPAAMPPCLHCSHVCKCMLRMSCSCTCMCAVQLECWHIKADIVHGKQITCFLTGISFYLQLQGSGVIAATQLSYTGLHKP